MAKEKRLGDLVRNAAAVLPNDEPKVLISLYDSSKRMMDIIPDTSAIKVNARLLFVNKLTVAGGYREAIKQAWEAIRTIGFTNVEDTIGFKVQVYILLAGLYTVINLNDSALVVLDLAVDDARMHANPLAIAAPLNETGKFFNKTGNPDAAIDRFHLADSIMNAHSEKNSYWSHFHRRISNNIAKIREGKEEFEYAKAIYMENFEFYENTDDVFRWIDAGLSLANAEVELRNYREAGKILARMELAMDSLDYQDELLNQLNLQKVSLKYYEGVGNMKYALLSAKKIVNLADSLNEITEKLHIQTSGTVAGYATHRIENRLEVATIAREAEEQRARLRLWIIILIACGATVTPTLLFYYYRQRGKLHAEQTKLHEVAQSLAREKLKTSEQEKKLVDIELEFKKKDLADLAINLSQKQEWARDLVLKIGKIESQKGHYRSREIKRMKEEVRSQVIVDQELEHLQQNIDTLNNEFYDRLKSSFPKLSRTETRLCSYIRLNLTNSQIAQLQNIDPESARTGRYRLKKKLNLGPGIDLEAFLSTL